MRPDAYDRRAEWTPKPRPDWVARLNQEGELLDMASVVPLEEDSLLTAARVASGLEDFGDDEWTGHFRVLLKAINEEARLNFAGRIYTRSELVRYLQQRLQITDWYKKHPEIEDEEIKEPVWIIGMGRCGTTIFHEVLSQDPQFRSPRRWELLYPVPPPTRVDPTDPRIAWAEPHATWQDRVTPEYRSMHAQGADLPVEDCEFVYPSFCTEVYYLQLQIPSYAEYFHRQDLSYMFWWHRRFLKLLQSGHAPRHWLLKNPTHMDRIPRLLEAYPDGKFIFMHRDPIVSADSVTDIMGVLYWQRTDDPWSVNMIEDSIMAQGRVRMWENIIGWIEDGTIPAGAHAHLQYKDLCERPVEATARCYRELGLTPSDGALDAMQAYLDGKPKGVFGAHDYEIGGGRQDVIEAERKMYQPYQDYFGVPSEA